MFSSVVVFRRADIIIIINFSQPEPLPSQPSCPMCFAAPKVCVII